MAIKKVVEIKANVQQAVQEMKDLFNAELEAVQEADKLNKELDKTGKDGAKSIDKASNSTKGFSNAIRGIGTAIKATGIGALIALLGSLTAILSENQTVIDTTKTAYNSLKLAVNDFTSFIGSKLPDVKKFFNEFGENPKKKLQELGTSLKDYLLRNLTLSVKALGLLGDSFKEFINGNFGASWDKLSESASTFVDAVSGVDDTLAKVSEKAKGYWDEADRIVNLQNNAKLAKALLEGEVEDYDRLAEKQRQIRDEERNTIEERIEANNKLGKILNQQEKAQTALANAIIASAQAEYNMSKNIENQVALIEAQKEAKAVLAQVEGFRSEQLVNQMALVKELQELEEVGNKGAIERTKLREQVDAQTITDQIARLEELNRIELDFAEAEKERLDNKVKQYREGTLAYQEAEQERLTFTEQALLEQTQRENEIALAKEQRDIEIQNRIIDNETLSFSLRLSALDDYNQKVLESELLSEYERDKILEENTRKRIQLLKAEKEARLMVYGAIAQAGNAMAQAVGEQTALGKSLAVASALISTYQGIANEMGTKTVTPYEIALKIANIATVAAVGFKSVKDILAVKIPNEGGGGGAGSAPQAQPPAFNIVGQSSTNQLAQTIAGQEQEPIKAYVVSKEITTQQNLDTNIKATASF